jgi:hypothetical protein
MKILVEKNTNKLIHITPTTRTVENGIEVQRPNGQPVVYPNPSNYDIYEVASIPIDIIPQKYLYDAATGAFNLNPSYVKPINTEQDLREQIEKNATMETLLNEIVMNPGIANLLEGGAA